MEQDLWIFGYGSLMWRPGFDYLEICHGLLYGYHRAFCVFSHVHRGTPEQPGLVFGLDRGGSCRGLAFRVAPSDAAEVRAYLRAREQVTQIYKEVMVPVRLDLEHGSETKQSLCYIVDREHKQYAGKVSFDTQVRMIAEATGQSGENPDYLRNTVEHLDKIGLSDAGLTRLWHAVETQLNSKSKTTL